MELIGLWFLLGILSAAVASAKGRSGCGWFLMGVLLGPLGLILALVVSKNVPQVEQQALESGEMKKCPYCAELIKTEAIECRYCGTNLLGGATRSCPFCGKLTEAGSRNCRECGQNLPTAG